MRYLGIDYGLRRTGIAVSDEGGKIAFPKATVRAKADTGRIREILRIAKRESAGAIVLGLPKDTSGAERGTARRVRVFLARLKRATDLPIELENELLSTRIASAAAPRKALIDAAAAAIILQSYLDGKRRRA